MPAKVIVQSLADYTHAQLVTADGRGFVADEPREDDGDGLGPSPYELLAAALGACTAMTIQIYARRKAYPVHEVAVEVEHERAHAKDCAECADGRDALIDVFRRRIVIRGPITDVQRDDLLRIAAKCPVHKTILSTPEVLDTIDVVA